MNDQERLHTFLAEQKYMTIAVTLDDGTPWVAPVRIQLQWGMAFEWDSKTDTDHSIAIAKRSTIAISTFSPASDNSEQFGFYATAKAELLKETDGMGRYQAVVTKAWINDASFIKREVSMSSS